MNNAGSQGRENKELDPLTEIAGKAFIPGPGNGRRIGQEERQDLQDVGEGIQRRRRGRTGLIP